MKMNIFGPCVELQLPLFKLIITPDPAKAASLKIEKYSLGFFQKIPSRGFSRIRKGLMRH